jgi:hypothetical protein
VASLDLTFLLQQGHYGILPTLVRHLWKFLSVSKQLILASNIGSLKKNLFADLWEEEFLAMAHSLVFSMYDVVYVRTLDDGIEEHM